jgi:hypothetical protein
MGVGRDVPAQDHAGGVDVERLVEDERMRDGQPGRSGDERRDEEQRQDLLRFTEVVDQAAEEADGQAAGPIAPSLGRHAAFGLDHPAQRSRLRMSARGPRTPRTMTPGPRSWDRSVRGGTTGRALLAVRCGLGRTEVLDGVPGLTHDGIAP